MIGDEAARLVRRLRNGNFEDSSADPFSKPYGWECEGDVRVLKILGEIEAYGQGMAFISTGIGANSQSNIDGTQGSILKQKIKNVNFKKLIFYYNCISEEPMEYVGSIYDDIFIVQISDVEGNILYKENFESINMSKWFPVNGVDFEDGDSTVYQTNWKIGTVDISEFQGQEIQIEFIVCDVGDSAYDTAVVIDNVLLDK